jgi:trehalose/maltose hydrolase-like predicted phosphorylase
MASVPEEGEAPVGARGLTGEGYRGHVFWDADTFTLPFLAATRPAAARAMLEYRVRRLPAARDIARACGRAGARFPWESARSGFDVTPTSARDRTGKLIRIRTGQLEEHIVAQVPWAACRYVEWTGDEEFARGAALQLLVETARYWRSRVRLQRDGTVHIDRVIGPDEYHDPVDDNAFTNVMARWNLRKAADAVEAAPDAAPDVGPDEIGRWRRIADAMVDGFDPDTGVYEQFKGFHDLEPLLIEEVAPRRPIAADLLLGTHRVRRAQVVKQADVLMLHHLVPDEVAPGTLGPNLRYYEPRTAHGSSLSPPVHASLFARAQDYGPALDALRIAADMDCADLTQSTAIGLHFATMGGLWQALAYGFAGLQARDDGLHIDPHLPPAWDALALRVRYRGSRVRVRCEQARITVHADPSAAVVVSSTRHTAGPGGLRLVRRGAAWEVAP